MAQELGYEQVSGINYLKEQDGWFEGFSLQASSYGNDFFYINYGVSVPNIWEPFENVIDKKQMGYLLSQRLHNDFEQGFPNNTKEQVEISAEFALVKYKEQAIPWFKLINDLNDITENFFSSTNLDKNKLGKHDVYLGLKAATYGLLLFKIGNIQECKNWLLEADRLYSQDKELADYEIEQHKTIHKIMKYINA